jgi:MFS family permease
VNLHGRATRHGLNEAGRWLALGALSLAQLMDVLENTIVNISLPSAQHDLGFSTENRQWIVTGYALAFGAFCFWGDGSLISSGVGGCP